MKIKQSLALLSILTVINSCFAMDDSTYGNVEIYNNSGIPLKVKLVKLDRRSINVIASSDNLPYQSTLEGYFTAWPYYSLEIEDSSGRHAKFTIKDVTDKNNIFVDITLAGNNGYNTKPYSSGIFNPTSRRLRPAKGNIKEKNIVVNQRQ